MKLPLLLPAKYYNLQTLSRLYLSNQSQTERDPQGCYGELLRGLAGWRVSAVEPVDA